MEALLTSTQAHQDAVVIPSYIVITALQKASDSTKMLVGLTHPSQYSHTPSTQYCFHMQINTKVMFAGRARHHTSTTVVRRMEDNGTISILALPKLGGSGTKHTLFSLLNSSFSHEAQRVGEETKKMCPSSPVFGALYIYFIRCLCHLIQA